MKSYDIVIVGAGSIGMATGYYLAKMGVNVLMIDANDPPHDKGSHGGDTRLIRHAYGEGRSYTPLALKSQMLWNQLQIQTHREIFKQTGVLNIGPEKSDFMEEIRKSAELYQLTVENLDHDAITLRYPGLALMDKPKKEGCLEPESGVLYVDQCLKTYRELALKEGAELIVNTAVIDLELRNRQAKVTTAAQTFICDQVLIAVGAWQVEWFKKLQLDPPLTVKRQVIGWFEADPALFDLSVFPGFTAETEDGLFYGFPSIDGSGVKIGRHDYGEPVNPNDFERDFSRYPQDEAVLRQFLEKWMPNAAGALIKGKTCLYTMTDDEDFIVDQHPQYKQVWLAAGFSGHGFKFASGVGQGLAELMTDGKSATDLSLFSLKRFLEH